MFNPAQAAGVYHLNLSDPYERAIAEELLQLARNIARQGKAAAERSNSESSGSEGMSLQTFYSFDIKLFPG
jgi:hypothetical protein